MEAKKLVSMTDYILSIDWMPIKEFCVKTGAQMPNVIGGTDSFLQIDATKYRLLVDYAKFLNQDLRLDMFIGECPKFKDFTYCTPKEATENDIEYSIFEFGENEYSITHKCISESYKKLSFCTSYHLKKVEDILKCSGDFFVK